MKNIEIATISIYFNILLYFNVFQYCNNFNNFNILKYFSIAQAHPDLPSNPQFGNVLRSDWVPTPSPNAPNPRTTRTLRLVTFYAVIGSWPGLAWPDRPCWASMAWLVLAWPGLAWVVLTRAGLALLGLTSPGLALPVLAWAQAHPNPQTLRILRLVTFSAVIGCPSPPNLGIPSNPSFGNVLRSDWVPTRPQILHICTHHSNPPSGEILRSD